MDFQHTRRTLYFLRRNRSKAVAEEVVGAGSGSLVSNCYAAGHHYDGPKQQGINPMSDCRQLLASPYLRTVAWTLYIWLVLGKAR